MSGETEGVMAPEFRIGAVVRRSFAVLAANIAPFFLLGVLFTLPSHLELFLPEFSTSADLSWIAIVAAIIGFLCLNLLTATIVYGTIVQLRGSHASILDCVAKGLGLLFPVLIVSLLAGLLIGLATMLLVIPGFFLFTILWVAVPAAVVERPGIIGSLRRSAQLTKGYRWQVFGVIAIFMIIGFVVNFVLIAPVVGAMASGAVWSSGLAGVVIVAVQALTSALSSVAVAVGYHDLRIAKEGVDTTQIAAVFD